MHHMYMIFIARISLQFFLVLRRTLASLRKRDRKSFIFPALGRTNQFSLQLYDRHKPIQIFISKSCRYTHNLNTKYLQIITWYTWEREERRRRERVKGRQFRYLLSFGVGQWLYTKTTNQICKTFSKLCFSQNICKQTCK